MSLPKLELTKGERLYLSRRRAVTPVRELAALLGVSIGRITGWEKGKNPDTCPAPVIEWITEHEWCHLQRLRHGFKVPDIAEFSGLPRKFILRAEKGVYDPTDLVAWWRGYLRCKVNPPSQPKQRRDGKTLTPTWKDAKPKP